MTHDVTPFRANRLRAAGQHATEETDGAIRVVGAVRDVQPLEVATVGHRVKLRVSAGAGDRGGNQ